jgi:hypothetical protein
MSRALILAPVLALAATASLAACQQPQPEKSEVEKATSAPAARTDALAAAPAVLTAADLRRVCRAGLAAVHGQTVDAIEVEGVTGDVVTAGWRAPVDGGRMRAECKVDRDLIAWRPLDLPDAEAMRWMTQSGDPVVRFAIDGDRITVEQTLPDGTSERSEATVPVQEEAR